MMHIMESTALRMLPYTDKENLRTAHLSCIPYSLSILRSKIIGKDEYFSCELEKNLLEHNSTSDLHTDLGTTPNDAKKGKRGEAHQAVATC